jgi:hypothetical protein
VEKAENRYGFKYVPGAKISDALPVAIRTMGAKKNAIDALLELFRPLDTNSCEVVATLFAAWNDLLLTGVEPTDEKIFFEARENWHPKKLNIPMQKWQRALDWMRKQNLVPKGRGRRVPRAN